jgi:choice-of-anchor A domain-containing protein/uncharacterized repeat protein (TIGR01451 family)
MRNKFTLIIAFALILSGLTTVINAKVQSIAQVIGIDIGVGIYLPAPVSDTYFTGTYQAEVDGISTSLYCIDLYHHMAYNSNYQDVEATNDTISYILNNYYPFKTSYPNMLGDIHREAAAIQLSLWHITDSLNISTLSGENNSDITDIKQRVAEILNDAFTNAHGYSLKTFEINIPAQSFTIGSPVTFTIQAFNDQGLAMPNVMISISTTQGTLSQTTVTTDSIGVSPQITLTPVAGQTTATISATGIVGIPSGTEYFNVADPNGKQKLILATPTTASRTISQVINWSSSYNLVVTKTADKNSVINGDIINYTITVKNSGSGNAQNVMVSDQLSSSLDFISASPSGVYNPAAGIWNAGTIAADDSVSLSIKVKVDLGNAPNLTYDLGAAAGFNLFVLDTLIQPSSDTQGKAAIGGYADLRNYSVGYNLPPNSGDVLVVGNDLTFISGAVIHGSAVYQKYITTTTAFTADGGIIKDSVIDFDQARTHLLNLSNQLSALVGTDTVKDEYNQVELIGHNDTLNIFNVSGTLVSSANNFIIDAPGGSVVIVNILGGSIKMSGGFSVTGTTIDKVLLNFPQADTITLSYINVTAAILAPNSVLEFSSGVVNGQVIVRCFYGAGQMNINLFDGYINDRVNIANFASLISASQANMPGLVKSVKPSSWIVANLSEGITGVSKSLVAPNQFNLAQNYPNPFNPSTIISFTVAKTEDVNISVFNIIGQRIITLTNKEYQPGAYSIQFNADKLPSGIYLYRLAAKDFVSTKKMLLIK